MYKRVLPHLNEIDKQDISILNEENQPDIESTEGEVPEMKMPKQDEEISLTENVMPTQVDANAGSILPQQMQIPQYTGNDISKKQKKSKQFSCEICVNKMFTTKHSLKRHYKSFHESKHIVNPPEPELKTQQKPDEEQLEYISKGLKRKMEPDDLSDQQQQKRIRLQTGVKRKSVMDRSDFAPNKKFHWTTF